MAINIPDVLQNIIEYKKVEVAQLKQTKSQSLLEAEAKAQSMPRGFYAALNAKTDGFALIAEIKKASPSKGLIRADFDPSIHAKDYQKGGAACLSILTDAPSFQGADEFLIAARANCELPCLRKDFMIDPIQIAQSRALGADAILLIMACLDDVLAKELFDEAAKHCMDQLIETHDEIEVERALKLGGNLIGINNRSLRTFETDLGATQRLAKLIPKSALVVSESGLYTHEDLINMKNAGAGAFLVGESLMRQQNLEEATKILLGG